MSLSAFILPFSLSRKASEKSRFKNNISNCYWSLILAHGKGHGFPFSFILSPFRSLLVESAWSSSFFFIIRSIRSRFFSNTNFIITYISLKFCTPAVDHQSVEKEWNVSRSRLFAPFNVCCAETVLSESRGVSVILITTLFLVWNIERFIAPHGVSLRFIALHRISSHLKGTMVLITILFSNFFSLHCVSLRFIAPQRFITFQYITLHYSWHYFTSILKDTHRISDSMSIENLTPEN